MLIHLPRRGLTFHNDIHQQANFLYLSPVIWNNGNILEGALSSYPGSTTKGWIYEVIRVIEGTPVFLPEHFHRLLQAMKITDSPILYSQEILMKGLFDLIRKEDIQEGNARIQADIKDGKMLIGFIPHQYPKHEDYINGVEVSLANLQRTNPGVKTWNKMIRTSADRIIQEKEIYEVILSSPEGFLLEGSRSNIFGIQNGALITPPRKQVLPGITRQIIISLTDQINIPLQEKPIHKSELSDFQSFFLTGTSPGILPIRKISSIYFNCKSALCNTLKNSYEKKIRESIANTKSNLKPL